MSSHTTIPSVLTQERLRELLHYDPETGVFTWRRTLGSRAKIGQRAGTVNVRGYRAIQIDGKIYTEHRLAFLYVFGFITTDMIDHININKTDNRICNLRYATPLQNLGNTPAPTHNTSGMKGVSFCKRTMRWRAFLTINRKFVHLGRFDRKEDAARAYEIAAREHFGGSFYRPQ